MKNKILIILVFLLFSSMLKAENLLIESKNIRLEKKGEVSIFENDVVITTSENNIIKSARGTKGGYRLNRQATMIKLSDIFSAVDEKIKTVKCNKHLKKSCNGKSIKCNTHDLWDELENYINDFFEKKYLSDLQKKNWENRI